MKQSSETRHTPTPWRLFQDCQLADGVYDKMTAAAATLRPHYEMFVNWLEQLGREEVAVRWETARRSLHDNGVTYNVYHDPRGMDRPWELDMMPLLIAPAEWNLEMQPPPGRARFAGADATHAWVSVYSPATGWIDVDPTNNLVPANRHITLAWGRDFSDVSPIRGVILGGGDHAVTVAVDAVALGGEP